MRVRASAAPNRRRSLRSPAELRIYHRPVIPAESERLRFRSMVDEDLSDLAALLGDPAVMTYYPAPKTRQQARAWIEWTKRNYAEHGFGLWVIETRDGTFVGDCGLTWQTVNGRTELEVGYHVRAGAQGRGLATEAAAACLEYARSVLQAPTLVAIIHPDNLASQRVAEKIGLRLQEEDPGGEGQAARLVYGTRLVIPLGEPSDQSPLGPTPGR